MIINNNDICTYIGDSSKTKKKKKKRAEPSTRRIGESPPRFLQASFNARRNPPT